MKNQIQNQNQNQIGQRYSPAIILGYGVIIISSTVLFLSFAYQVRQHGTFWFDTPVLTFLYEHRTAALDNFFLLITWAGSGFLLYPVSIIIVSLLLRYHNYREALLLGIGFSGVNLINSWLKTLFLRDRPILFLPLQDYESFAFPSGHSAQVTAFALSAFLIVRRIQPRRQGLAAILLIILVLCVTISRLYLQVHYPSDVLGGFLFAVMWVFSVDVLIQLITKTKTLRKTGG